MITSERHLFDIPAGVAYFNCAFNTPQLNEARSALLQAAQAKSRPWECLPVHFFENAEKIRLLAVELFGGDADGYAVVPSSTYAIGTAVRAIEPLLKPGDEILVMAEEFPSNYLPWQRAAKETGAVISVVPTPIAGDWASAFAERITPRTKVVAAGHCHWTNGAYVDLEVVAQAARRVGAFLVLDVTQSLGAMSLNLSAIRPDFMVASGYKWMLWPYGVGLFYVAPQWRDARPLEETWLARDNASDFARLANYSNVYLPGARRFEVGEKSTALLPGAIAALNQVKAWTLPGIEARLSHINGRIAEYLETLGFILPPASQRCPHMFGARLPDGFQGDLVGKLRAKNVYVSQRGNAVRFAPHLHVTEADLQQLFDAIGEVCALSIAA